MKNLPELGETNGEESSSKKLSMTEVQDNWLKSVDVICDRDGLPQELREIWRNAVRECCDPSRRDSSADPEADQQLEALITAA